MTKNDLIKRTQKLLPDYPAKDVAFAVQVIFDAMTRALKKDERIDIRGFGSFTVRLRDCREARNPRTGSSVRLNERRVPFFKMGKEIQTRINAQE